MQAIYILSRYPRFGWEDVFVPVADVVFYGLQAGNAGYRLQYNGKAIPWVRYMQWALLTPVLLGQFARMGSYKFLEFNANTMLIGRNQGPVIVQCMRAYDLVSFKISLFSIPGSISANNMLTGENGTLFDPVSLCV